MKNPLLAAILNIYPGLGYLYLDVKQSVAWVVYISFTFAAVNIFEAVMSSDAPTVSLHSTGYTIWLATLIALWAALIIDAYQTAKKQEVTKRIGQKSAAIAASQILGSTAVQYA